MGQKFGKPSIDNKVAKFTNLPREGIESLWRSYNLHGEGWGLSFEELESVFTNASYLSKVIGFEQPDLRALFTVFDSDKNGLVDALEILVVIAIISGMDFIDKIQFCFSSYDFTETGSLGDEELTLLFRTVIKGLSKISTMKDISEKETDRMAELIFRTHNRSLQDQITVAEFQSYCGSHPVISSWLKHYCSISAQTAPVVSGDLGDLTVSLTPASTAATPATKKIGPLPWFAEADALLPEEPPLVRTDPAEDILEPVWVHAYRGSDRRANGRYGKGGNILYYHSNVAVSLQKEGEEPVWTQKFLYHHDYAITSMDVDCFSRRYCVTVDGVDPSTPSIQCSPQKDAKIVLWDTTTYEPVSSALLTGCPGVRAVSFSSDAKFLIVAGTDVESTVTIFTVPQLKSLYSQRLGATILSDICFAGSSVIFAAAGTHGLDFFVEESGGVLGKNGALLAYERRSAMFHTVGKDAEKLPMTAVSRFEAEDEIVSGNTAGQVLLWRGRNCIQLLKLHNGAVTSLAYCSQSRVVASGGKDGKIHLLSLSNVPLSSLSKQQQQRLVATATVETSASLHIGTPLQLRCPEVTRLLDVAGIIDVRANDVINPEVKSLCLSDTGEKVLVGTRSGELLELSCISKPLEREDGEPEVDPESEEGGVASGLKVGDDLNAGPLIKSHWKASSKTSGVSGLCKLASGFASCGGDGSVRVWQESEGAPHKALVSVVADSGCTCIGASATEIAVGLDGSGNTARLGAVQIYSLGDLKFVVELKDSKSLVTATQFSPDGTALAVAGSDSKVYYYSNQSGEWKLQETLMRHGAPVLGVDFSSDGRYIRSWDAGDGLLVWDLGGSKASVEADPEVLKPLVWATSSCPCGWDCKGIWSGLTTNDKILSADRSNSLLVTGRANGVISLHRIPVIDFDSEKSNAVELRVHLGAVSAVCFINEGTQLVSAGLEDGAIIVWKVTYDTDEAEPDPLPEEQPEEEEEPEPEEEEEEGEGAPKKEVFLDSADDEDLLDYDGNLLAHLPAIKSGESTNTPLSAVSNWVTAVGLSPASLMSQPASTLSNDELQLSWIYGYSSRLTRSSIRYSKTGKILYPAATMGVILDKTEPRQFYSMNHTDDITCLEVHPTRALAATGQRGRGGVFVCIWDSETGTAVRYLYCGDVNGVSALAFNADGSYLAVSCQDKSHTILIFDWEHSESVKARVYGGAKKVLCLSFGLSKGIRLLQGGVGHFRLLDLVGSQLFSKNGLYGPDAKKFNVVCAAALPTSPDGGNEFVMGMPDGTLAAIGKGERRVSNYSPIQEKPITAIYTVILSLGNEDEGPVYKIVTGGVDGLVKVLDQDFNPLNEFNLYSLKKNYGLHKLGKLRGIKSICADPSSRKILYGTSGGEIGEIDFESGLDLNKGPLVQGHCRDECHGLSTHPIRPECITVGDDRTLRVWNLDKKAMVSILDLPDIARTVAYSPTGQLIAVGLGGIVKGAGRVPRPSDGKVVMISFFQGELRIVHEFHDAHGPVSCIIFSPDGSRLFVATLEGKIYVYDVLDNFNSISVFDKHAAGIRSLDITQDGKLLSSVDTEAEILLWDLEDMGALVREALKTSLLATAQWYLRQNTLCNDSVGVFPAVGGRPSDVACISRSADKRLLCTGDVFGNVSLFRYPSKRPGTPSKQFCGHSPGGVSRVAFSVKDQYLMSLGKEDKTMFQWRLLKVDDNLCQPSPSQTVIPNSLLSLSNMPLTAVNEAVAGVSNYLPMIHQVDLTQGLSNSKLPVPDVKIRLSSVLGVQSASLTPQHHSPFPSALYTGSGDVSAVAGRVAVSLRPDRTSQILMQVIGSQDIGAYAVSSDLRYVATGEKGALFFDDEYANANVKGKLRVFLASTGGIVSELPAVILGGVKALAFSPDGKYLGCIGRDHLSTLTILFSATGLWTDAILFFSSPTDSNASSVLTFVTPQPSLTPPSPAQHPPPKDEYLLATGGYAPLRFWKFSGKNAIPTVGQYKDGQQQAAVVTCLLSVVPGEVVAGDAAGNITIWEGHSVKNVYKSAHSSAVSAISKYPVSSSPVVTYGVITASSDSIKVWTQTWEVSQTIPLSEVMAGVDKPYSKSVYVTSLCSDLYFRRLLITTNSSAVIEMSTDSKVLFLVSEGLPPNHTGALAPHPKDPRYLATGSADGFVRLWDLVEKRVVETHALNFPVTDVCFRPDGSALAAAFMASKESGGSVVIMSFSQNGSPFLSTLQKIVNVGQGGVTRLRYSPDEVFLAVGSEDKSIYLYDVRHAYKLKGNFRSHSKPVLGFDFSSSGKFLRSYSRNADESAVETKICELHDEHVPAAVEVTETSQLQRLVKEKWATVSSPAVPEARAAIQDVTTSSVAVDPQQRCLVGGYNDGSLRVFRYPANATAADVVLGHSHATGPVHVAFTSDGRHICSLGGFDGTIMIWDVIG